MCGIFGFAAAENSLVNHRQAGYILNDLFKLSESRGKEAAGMAVLVDGEVEVVKEAHSASSFIKGKEFFQFFDRVIKNRVFAGNGCSNQTFGVIGHSRLVTNGVQEDNRNNQPVSTYNLVGVHNGIIVNDEELWSQFSSLERRFEVDTEVFLALMHHFYAEKGSWSGAVESVFNVIEGAASVAVISEDCGKMVLATNTGSLYIAESVSKSIYFFASERYILQTFINKEYFNKAFGQFQIRQIKPYHGVIIDLVSQMKEEFSINPGLIKKVLSSGMSKYSPETIPASFMDTLEKINNLRRCTRCILPETMPFIQFDEDGVCNYCHGYKKMEIQGPEALAEAVDKYRKRSGQHDCIVAFSGGRDSSYGLHYVKEVLGMNPIAYTYDWGMVTDLARRNQARICGKLGIEHILVSADITTKRRYIKKNVEAWLRKPELGMVPLFMAGDKQFYYYANKLKQQNDIDLIIFSAGNQLENTDFKTGFCGIEKGSSKGMLDNIRLSDKLRLIFYYAKNYITNPHYINSSLFDTVFAYFSSYMLDHDYLYLYHYLDWNEDEMMSMLTNEYNWEVDSNTKVIWRIGDGTAAFYNYIYYTVAGLTENDTFRSNQIREGMITREKALEIAAQENLPRFDSIKTYCSLIGIDFAATMKIIDSIPKLF